MAPKPAPAEIPSSPGSARLFFNNDCKIIPEHESAAPILIAFKTLGRRISRITLLYISLSDENTVKISEKGILTLPIEIEIITDTISAIRSRIRSNILFNSFYLVKIMLFLVVFQTHIQRNVEMTSFFNQIDVNYNYR